MESSFWITVIIIVLASLFSAALFMRWVFNKENPGKSETAKESAAGVVEPSPAMKRWRIFGILWPLLCIVFCGIILFQYAQRMEGRILEDAAFTIIPLIFWAIGFVMGRRLLKERRYATAHTTATVVSRGKRVYAGRKRYYPEYEFQDHGKTYKVTTKRGYSVCLVAEGRKVKLYYAPENPELFYVPVMQKHDIRWTALLCGVGIVCPLMGLLAPLMR